MFRFFLVLLFFLNLSFPLFAEERRVVDIVSFDYPVYLYEDVSGILPAILKEIISDDKISFNFHIYPRKRAVQFFSKEDKGEYLFLGEARYFPELEGKLIAEKLISAQMVMLYLKESFPDFKPAGLEDFKNYSVGTSLGSNFSALFSSLGIRVQESRIENNIRKLKAGRIDFWHTLDLVALEKIEDEFPGERDSFAFWVHDSDISVELVARKDGPAADFLKDFSEKIRRFKAGARYKQILEEGR